MPWSKLGDLKSRSFTCGHCGHLIASSGGWGQNIGGLIYVCTHCDKPTYFNAAGVPLPGVTFGESVAHLPEQVASIYDEARRCTAASAFTASVLLARKLLMNVAVSQGAKPSESFISYVEYLANSGFVPPNGKGWVDHIRRKGNEATHEITVMTEADAKDLLSFAELLLKFIYEFPKRVPGSAAG